MSPTPIKKNENIVILEYKFLILARATRTTVLNPKIIRWEKLPDYKTLNDSHSENWHWSFLNPGLIPELEV